MIDTASGWDRERARQRLGAALDVLRLSHPPDAAGKLLDLCALLAAWSLRMNLTAHHGPDAILDRLVLDALALARVLPGATSIADLGSGAGFPGLPLAILHPERRISLVESRERKHHFQREAVRRLGLENVHARLGRSDEIACEPHGGVLAQAVARPARAATLSLPWAARGGWVAIPGGATPPAIETPAGVDTVEIRQYRVPITDRERSVWIGRRSASEG